MTVAELQDLLTPWLSQGVVSPVGRESLRVAYLDSLGSSPPCTTCPDFFNDALHWAKMQLKAKGYSIPMTKRAYMLADGVDYIKLPADNVLIINEGEPRDGVLVLTDAIAKELLTRGDAYSEMIVKNPAYVAPAKETPKAPTKETAPHPAK